MGASWKLMRFVVTCLSVQNGAFFIGQTQGVTCTSAKALIILDDKQRALILLATACASSNWEHHIHIDYTYTCLNLCIVYFLQHTVLVYTCMTLSIILYYTCFIYILVHTFLPPTNPSVTEAFHFTFLPIGLEPMMMTYYMRAGFFFERFSVFVFSRHLLKCIIRSYFRCMHLLVYNSKYKKHYSRTVLIVRGSICVRNWQLENLVRLNVFRF